MRRRWCIPRSGDQQLAQLALITEPLGPAATEVPHVRELDR